MQFIVHYFEPSSSIDFCVLRFTRQRGLDRHTCCSFVIVIVYFFRRFTLALMSKRSPVVVVHTKPRRKRSTARGPRATELSTDRSTACDVFHRAVWSAGNSSGVSISFINLFFLPPKLCRHAINGRDHDSDRHERTRRGLVSARLPKQFNNRCARCNNNLIIL